nr:uncharacterized protein LOC128689148 [Cherax quadricarinatus]
MVTSSDSGSRFKWRVVHSSGRRKIRRVNREDVKVGNRFSVLQDECTSMVSEVEGTTDSPANQAAFIVPSRQVDCPGDFINFSVDPTTPVCIQFYMYGKITKGSWSEIRAKCQKEGADLAELKGDLHIQVRDYIFNHPGETIYHFSSSRIEYLLNFYIVSSL